MTAATYGQWEPTTPPFGATRATKMSQPVGGGGAILTTRISNFNTFPAVPGNPPVDDTQVVDEHTDTTATANGTTTVKSTYLRNHERPGEPNNVSTGHTTIVGSNLHLTWQLSFTDSQGLVTRQVGATAVTMDRVVELAGVQSVSTSHPDGTATQIHIQWSRPSLTGDAIRRTEKTDANNNTTTTVDHAWSSGNGPWQTSGAQPQVYDDDPSLDALPPPFGPLGPVIGGDPIFVMDEPPPTAPAPSST